MSTISIEGLYYGGKYDVLGKVAKVLLKSPMPATYDGQTWLEILLVKHGALAMREMIQ